MRPHIDATEFGSITVDGTVYEHDVIIRPGGEVRKRKKKLSKAVYGTSHVVSLGEARHLYSKGAKSIIIGTGQQGMLSLSREAETFFAKKDCGVLLRRTPEAAREWNKSAENIIGMFHITC